MLLQSLKRWGLVSVLVWGMMVVVLPVRASAAESQEARNAFQAAAMAFNDGFFDRSERAFAKFLIQHPDSPKAGEAALRQGQSLFHLKRFDEAISVFEQHKGLAGTLGDLFHYWEARAYWEQGKFSEAAKVWKDLTVKFPKSVLRAEALYSEALAYYQMKDWKMVANSLAGADSLFGKLLKLQPTNEYIIKGQFLLAEALLEEQETAAAEKTLSEMANQQLSPEQNWQRLQLLTRVQRDSGRLKEAAQTAVGLVALARTLDKKELLAESVALQGGLLQSLKQYDAAVQVWQVNLGEGIPVERQRQALFSLIELAKTQSKNEQAREMLADFAKKNPADAAISVVHLTLGELALQDYYRLKGQTNSLTDTNLLQSAQAAFTQALADKPDEGTLAKAHLGRAWSYWEQQKMPEATADFSVAADKLKEGVDQAIARFKWADCQFAQSDFEGALANYLAVLDQYSGNKQIRNGLLDKALYQLVRVGVRLGRQDVASASLEKLLNWFPDRYYSENSLLLVGQSLGHAGETEAARRLLDDFLSRFPNSPKASEIQLARARVSVQERNWADAIGIYTNWLNQFTNNVSRPRALFDLGWLQFKAGNETGAFNIYTNFLAQYPTNGLVQQTHFWLAEHYERQKDFASAETHYQLVFQNTNQPPNELAYRARLMAGRAAFSSQLYDQSKGYFLWLITNGPPEVAKSAISTQLVAQAYFALGDNYLARPELDPAKAMEKFGDAINVFEMIPRSFTNSNLVPLAWSKIANCHLQLAAQDTNRYSNAIDYYTRSVESPEADVETREQAEIGLGKVFEKLARLQPQGEGQAGLFNKALDHYQNVVYGTLLKEGEDLVPFTVEQAGVAGGKLLEELGRKVEAAQFYRRVGERVPALHDAMERKADELAGAATGGS